VLFLDDNDWHFYQWAQQEIDIFNEKAEKSNIWLSRIKSCIINGEPLTTHKKIEDFDVLLSTLENLKKAAVYS